VAAAMKPSVYVETSVVSYLTSRPSRDVVVVARQQVTQTWWNSAQGQCELFTSPLVIEEASVGDAKYAEARLKLVEKLTVLDINDQARQIANRLLEADIVPSNAAADALHIGIAVAHGINFLITWNFRHLANAKIRSRVDAECTALGFRPTLICTCEQLPENKS
jgi:predicted nucleic acid-binding protein